MFKIILKPKFLLITILLLAAILRFYRLGYPKGYVFDEVYHAFTAREYVAGHKEAWAWWTTPPPGVAYEWTHPPLAKEIMAGSMILLNSQESWTWRFPGVLLGILSIYLVYLLAQKLFNKKTISLISAFIFSIDGLNFVQSRTGMNDIYYITFVLASLLFILNKKYFWGAVLLGMALSSKWAAIYTYLLFIPLLISNRSYRQVLFFFIIPPVIYLLSYIPFFLLGHTPQQFIQLQQQMWWYHTGLKATHGYSSPWWSWPLNLYPVWYFVDYQGNKIANIFASGNPVIFWGGSIAIFFTIWDIFRKKMSSLLIVVLGFLIFWLPWAISPRIMFLYHFSPCVPFLSIALGYQLRKQKYILILLGLMVLSFLIIFPFLTGIPIPREFVNVFFTTNLSKNPF